MGEVIQMGPQPIALSKTESIAARTLLQNAATLNQQHAQLQQLSEQHNLDHAEVCAEIAAAHGLAAGAIGTTHGFSQDGAALVALPQAPAAPQGEQGERLAD